jgi:hypothetical protein
MKFHGKAIGLVFSGVLLGAAGAAHANTAAVWAEGQGGFDAPSLAGNPAVPALGLQLGARVLVFEGYVDHSGFGDGSAVTRGIVGLRGGFGSGDTRLVLHAGAGVLDEQGGAVTGHVAGTPDRHGAVGRIGGAVETKLSSDFLFGLGLDAETFELPAAGVTAALGSGAGSGSVVGSDVFANLHLTFELGV